MTGTNVMATAVVRAAMTVTAKVTACRDDGVTEAGLGTLVGATVIGTMVIVMMMIVTTLTGDDNKMTVIRTTVTAGTMIELGLQGDSNKDGDKRNDDDRTTMMVTGATAIVTLVTATMVIAIVLMWEEMTTAITMATTVTTAIGSAVKEAVVKTTAIVMMAIKSRAKSVRRTPVKRTGRVEKTATPTTLIVTTTTKMGTPATDDGISDVSRNADAVAMADPPRVLARVRVKFGRRTSGHVPSEDADEVRARMCHDLRWSDVITQGS